MTVIAGIDASLTGFAVTIWRKGDEQPDYWSHQEMSTVPSDGSVRGRLSRIHDLLDFALSQTEKCSVIFIEGYAHGAKYSGVTLAELGGILRWMFLEAKKTVVEVPPAILKQFATGKGNANKMLVVSELTSRYGVTFQTDNLADSFALAKLGLSVLDLEKPQTAFQRKAVEKVKASLEKELAECPQLKKKKSYKLIVTE